MMSKKSKLPALKKGGDQTALTTTAIIGAIGDYFVPVAGTAFAQLCGRLVKNRMDRAENILIERMIAGDMDILTEQQYEAFIPMGYRFYDAARRGESTKKLHLLARFLTGVLAEPDPKPDEFLRLSAKLEILGDKDIEIISAIYKLFLSEEFIKSGTRENLKYFEAEQIVSWSWIDTSSSISALITAGLIVPDGGTAWGKSVEYYFITEDFLRICKFALDIDL